MTHRHHGLIVACLVPCLAAGNLRSSPSETVQVTVATLGDGTAATMRRSIRGARTGPPEAWPRSPERFHETTIELRLTDGSNHLLARRAAWLPDVASHGGSWHELIVASPGGDGFTWLDVASALHASDRSLTIVGRSLPVTRRAPPDEWWPADLVTDEWRVEIATGRRRGRPGHVEATTVGTTLRIVATKDGAPIANVGIDVAGRSAVERDGLPAHAEWPDPDAPAVDASLFRGPPPPAQQPPPE